MQKYVVWDGLTGSEVYFSTESAARCYYEAAVSAYHGERHLIQLELVEECHDGVYVVDVLNGSQYGVDIEEAV